MAESAKITVTSGPDKGRVFELSSEIVRLGRSAENEVALTDPQIHEQHATIVHREGRFAIQTTAPEGLEVDGTQVPPERWVWLPDAAKIRLGTKTGFEFVTVASSAAGESETAIGAAPVGNGAAGATRTGGKETVGSSATIPREKAAKAKRPVEISGTDSPARPKRTAADKGEKDRGDKSRKTTVARFITDGPGDPLVNLGEDGHLPELALHEAHAAERKEAGPKQSNPTLLIIVFGVSIGLTALMLLMDVDGFGGREQQLAKARLAIAKYCEVEGNGPLKPYQESLREAQRARSRRDRDGERRAYREVLAMLRSEAKDKVSRYTGLTGRLFSVESEPDAKSDEQLENLIGILLSE